MNRVGSDRSNRSGGSAGGGGYDFQAETYALIAAKMLASESLNFPETGCSRIPVAVSMETGSGGDDLAVLLASGATIDIQVKVGLDRGDPLWYALTDLVRAIMDGPNTYGVIITDTSASSTVRNDLADDIKRIGQGRTDDLHDIGRDFLKRLTSVDCQPTVCCSRLRIVVRDFGPGSSGEEETLATLRRVVIGPMTAAGRRLLVSDGMDLIALRGRRDVADLVNLLLSDSITPSPEAPNPVIARESYRAWCVRSNETFAPPGLGIALPIEFARSRLRAMFDDVAEHGAPSLGEQLRTYDEWYRLAERDLSTDGGDDWLDDTLSIESATDNERLLVIVAGPGAGKSTMLRRLAWRLASDAGLPLRVSLPVLATQVRLHSTFDDALYSAGAAVGLTLDSVRSACAGGAVTLLADGLDEADPDRATIADGLRGWALADDRRRVVVTTRPVGYDPIWFGGWKHFELVPLTLNDVQRLAARHYKARFPSEAEALTDERVRSFAEALDYSKTAMMASRNPQLLGILLALYANGRSLERSRSQLFADAIELFRVQNRSGRIFRKEMSEPRAKRVLDCLAWQLLHEPMLERSELIRRVGTQISVDFSESSFVAQDTTVAALSFWEERGLIETLSAGGQRTILFVHVTFRDFAAARYLADLSDSEVRSWIQQHASAPRMKDAIILSGGTARARVVLSAVLDADDPADPASTAYLLAADVLLASEAPLADFRIRVTDSLSRRLASSIPDVAGEAAERLLPLARAHPGAVGPIVRGLLSHKYVWTREVAMSLALVCGADYVDDVELVELYPGVRPTTFVQGHGAGTMLHRQPLRQELLVNGAAYLLRQSALPNEIDAVKQALSNGRMSINTYEEIAGLIRMHLDPDEQVPRPFFDATAFAAPFGKSAQDMRLAELILVNALREAASRICGNDPPSKETSPNGAVARLLGALNFGDTPVPHLCAINHFPADHMDIVEVMRGAVLASGIEPARVNADANYILGRLGSPSARLLLLFDNSADSTADTRFDWHLASGAALDADLLCSALENPIWFISDTAAELLLHAVDRQSARNSIESLIRRTNAFEALMFVAQVAGEMWCEDAADVVLTRLENQMTGLCTPLLRVLGDLCKTSDERLRAERVLRKAMVDHDAAIVEASLCASAALGLSESFQQAIRDSLKWWLTDGLPEQRRDGPISPNAAPSLIKQLDDLRVLSFADARFAAERSMTANRSDVREVAVNSLCRMISEDDSHVLPSLCDVEEGILPALILDVLSRGFPAVCQKHAAIFVRLVASRISSVSLAAVRALGGAWIDVAEAEPVLRGLCDGVDVPMRNEALRALRNLIIRQADS